ncbi:uncharacterized protein RHOBADRAFT_52875 [Rhodotorula graminis WP1]|uniref:Uncharacterized protein n=1 Tax=Rhodotorula graminis (strain WP1) TaxID=578459 RepID=A0A194S545_RHOGW|nr:uncharacterized protein RHOBADRAFT_52875 [Rhodotorula graminis WP1]KPV75858.1 hypothetical protein RHOBADRAFT_52875 [Rhodotorula graminis WP1]
MEFAVRTREPTEDGVELPFGDFCLSCGNATMGSTYCSSDCRKADLERSEASPDDSPFLSAVPPLVPSAKSVCSTPPSSANNSPSPRSGMLHLADPPSLDLPPPKHRFEYGGQSLPNGGGRYSPAWTINYQPDPLASPLVSAADAAAAAAKDLPYRRKPGRLHAAVPSPLYFRQKAAAAHSSPAFNPTSPSSRFVALPTMADFSGAHVHEDDIAALSLPGQCDSAEQPTLVAPPSHCGRPGCVGVPKRPKLETSLSSFRSSSRRLSGPGSPALRGLASLDTTDEVLLSPRIRALRTGQASPVEPRESPLASPSPSEGEEHDPHSAFACYLFSHLSTEAPVERGRSASIDQSGPEMQRSLSVDAALPSRAVGNSSPSASMSPAPRPRRAMFGGRGGPAALNVRTEPSLRPLTPTPSSPTADDDIPLSTTVRASDLDRDATIRPGRGRGAERARLTPGHYIQATSETPSGVSPFPSPPPSPPTAGRGRSVARRNSNATDAAPAAEGRGRSGARGHGAVKRSMSPSARKASPSPSPAPTRSRSRASHSRSRGRVSAPADRGRGRTRERERTLDEEEPSGDDADGEADAPRGRGRSSARDERSRSRSELRRGRGREVVYSRAAYGHGESSEDDR